jgi:hypothetical protein
MSANRNLERRLADHYVAEAPRRAPDWILGDVLTTIDTTPQRRGLLAPWRSLPMPTYAKLAAAAVAVAAVVVIGVWQLGPPPGPGAPTVPSTAQPSASTPATPGPTAVPTARTGIADSFVRPFSFVLPGVPTFEIASSTDRYFEARVPEWFEDQPSHMGGLIIQAVGGGLTDPCDRTSTPMPLQSDPEGVFTYLKGIPGVTVTNESPTTVDGRPARQATLVATTSADCPEIWAWQHPSGSFITGAPLRVIAFDVDAEPIVIAIFGEPENPDLPALADEILASLTFRPVPSPGA